VDISQDGFTLMNQGKETTPNFSFKLFKVFILILSLKIINAHLVDFLNTHYFKLKASIEDAEKTGSFVILSVVIGPIIETLLFQKGLHQLLLKLKVTNDFLILVIPSILFGLWHPYNWLYIVYTFFGGLLLNWFYLYAKVNVKYAFWWVASLHSLFNLYVFIINVQ
jgi:membrane protease YdiL (CAAX protease family)